MEGNLSSHFQEAIKNTLEIDVKTLEAKNKELQKGLEAGLEKINSKASEYEQTTKAQQSLTTPT